MRRSKIEAGKQCPKCGKVENQVKMGYNRSGTQRCMCKECGTRYTIAPKTREYSEETRELAIKMYYSGVSGRGVGKVLGMSKANVYNWIKKRTDCWKLAGLFRIRWVVLVYWRKAKHRNPWKCVCNDGSKPKSTHDVRLWCSTRQNITKDTTNCRSRTRSPQILHRRIYGVFGRGISWKAYLQ